MHQYSKARQLHISSLLKAVGARVILIFVVSLVIYVDAEGAICGNMVVEENEECDCGYVEDESCKDDICCEGRNNTNGCKRKPGKICTLVRFVFLQV